MRRRTLLGAALACLALSPAASVSHATVRVDHVQVPFYARGVDGGKWTAVIFYRPPSCIPGEFNLLAFFDVPRVFGCEPMSMDGYAVFENGQGIDPAPLLSRLDGKGAVPIWFVRTREYEKATADGVTTLGDLQKLDPLRGSARFYSEVLKTDPDRAGSHFSALATGRLANGRAFAYVTLSHYEHGRLINHLTMF
jgi:hypothetical protein